MLIQLSNTLGERLSSLRFVPPRKQKYAPCQEESPSSRRAARGIDFCVREGLVCRWGCWDEPPGGLQAEQILWGGESHLADRILVCRNCMCIYDLKRERILKSRRTGTERVPDRRHPRGTGRWNTLWWTRGVGSSYLKKALVRMYGSRGKETT